MTVAGIEPKLLEKCETGLCPAVDTASPMMMIILGILKNIPTRRVSNSTGSYIKTELSIPILFSFGEWQKEGGIRVVLSSVSTTSGSGNVLANYKLERTDCKNFILLIRLCARLNCCLEPHVHNFCCFPRALYFGVYIMSRATLYYHNAFQWHLSLVYFVNREKMIRLIKIASQKTCFHIMVPNQMENTLMKAA